jgi:uncharacterized protein with FMN-binding domain
MKTTLNIFKPGIFLIFLFIICSLNCSGFKQNKEKKESKYLKIENINFKKVRDGEYVGKYNLNINSARISILVKDGAIIKIDILKHYHGPGYGADKLTEELIKKQTLEVDAISGATKSSYVLKKAVEDALRQGL